MSLRIKNNTLFIITGIFTLFVSFGASAEVAISVDKKIETEKKVLN